MSEYNYYSQFKQDKFLNKYFFKGKREGVFVEVGAYDGIKDSNSLFFERELNWSGICVEPLPEMFKKLMNNRNDKCHNIMCSIDSENGVKPFIKHIGITDLFSGLKDHYDERFSVLVDNAKKVRGGFYDEIMVKTHPLKVIFEQLKIDKVDYLSVDTCSSEMNVFKSIDYDKVFIHMISFDDTIHELSLDIIEYLKQFGFVYVTKLGGDIIMINEKSEYVPEVRDFKVEL